MATFVGYLSEEEQAIKVASWVNDLLNKDKTEKDESFLKDCKALSESNQNLKLLEKLFDQQKTMFEHESPKEIRSTFFVLISLMKTLGNEASKKLVPKVVDDITSDTSNSPKLRLKILNDLYNSVQNTSLQRTILLKLLKFTQEANIQESLNGQYENIFDKLEKLEVSSDEKKDILKIIRDFYENKDSSETYKWTLKLLSCFETVNEEAISESTKAAFLVIKAPSLFQFDELLQIESAQQLKTKNPDLHRLLEIFTNEDTQSFQNFGKEHPNFFKENGIDYDAGLYKIRLLSLASLGANVNPVSYSAIAKALQIEESEVEMWVISAITEKVLDAKLDQVQKIAVIHRCLNRVFTESQWQKLNDNLSSWKKNIDQLLVSNLQNWSQHTLQAQQ